MRRRYTAGVFLHISLFDITVQMSHTGCLAAKNTTLIKNIFIPRYRFIITKVPITSKVNGKLIGPKIIAILKLILLKMGTSVFTVEKF